MPLLPLLLFAAAALAVIDGVIRVRGRGTPILAVIEIIVAGLVIVTFFTSIPVAIITLVIVMGIVLVLQLVLRGSRRRARVSLTVIALILTAIYLVLALNWIHVPGFN
jgi:uncharacterized membrane protein